jgi:hypothetical protein
MRFDSSFILVADVDRREETPGQVPVDQII